MKYRIQREGLSMTITAQSREEAEGDFCARLAQKVEWLKGEEVKRKPSTRGKRGHGR